MFKFTPTLSEPTYEGFIDPTGDGLEMAILECMDEHGFIAAEASAVMGSIKGKATVAWEKTVKFLKDLKARAIAWFHAVVQRIQAMIRAKSAFVKKHRETLLKKDSSDFEYTAYPYQLIKGAEKTEQYAGELQELIALSSASDVAEEKLASYLSSKNVNSIEEIAEDLRKTFRGGDKEVPIKNFSVTSVEEMLDELTDADKVVAANKKDFAEFEKHINKTIKELESGKGENVTNHGLVAKLYTGLLNMARVSMDSYVEGVNSYFKTLSAFLAYKPNTKSDDKVTESAEELLYSMW